MATNPEDQMTNSEATKALRNRDRLAAEVDPTFDECTGSAHNTPDSFTEAERNAIVGASHGPENYGGKQEDLSKLMLLSLVSLIISFQKESYVRITLT